MSKEDKATVITRIIRQSFPGLPTMFDRAAMALGLALANMYLEQSEPNTDDVVKKLVDRFGRAADALISAETAKMIDQGELCRALSDLLIGVAEFWEQYEGDSVGKDIGV
jgi:hypothetical protein